LLISTHARTHTHAGTRTYKHTKGTQSTAQHAAVRQGSPVLQADAILGGDGHVHLAGAVLGVLQVGHAHRARLCIRQRQTLVAGLRPYGDETRGQARSQSSGHGDESQRSGQITELRPW